MEAARLGFNEKGYATTTLAEIAAAVDISQGNLTYHFPTKRHLVTRIQELVAEEIAERRATRRPGTVEDDYVSHLSFVMRLTATYRFLLRDDAQIEPGPDHRSPHQVLVDDFAAIRRLVDRVEGDGLFRRDLDVDVEILARSLWILSRYWMEHLSEMELRREITWEDQHRGIVHHFAVLLPNLTAEGRRRFSIALDRLTSTGAETDLAPVSAD